MGWYTVSGTMGRDPERKQTKAGDLFITFPVASTERRLEGGTWVDAGTSWYEVTAFKAAARGAVDVLHKGDPVVVHGELTVEQWTGKDGRPGRTVRLRATALGHDLARGGARRPASEAQPDREPATVAAGTGWAADPDPEEDTPF